MPNEESQKVSEERERPPVSLTNVGEDKCAEVDTSQPTPERKAKTGEKS